MYKIETFIPQGSLQDIRKAYLKWMQVISVTIGDVYLTFLLLEFGFRKKDPILL